MSNCFSPVSRDLGLATSGAGVGSPPPERFSPVSRDLGLATEAFGAQFQGLQAFQSREPGFGVGDAGA